MLEKMLAKFTENTMSKLARKISFEGMQADMGLKRLKKVDEMRLDLLKIRGFLALE